MGILSDIFGDIFDTLDELYDAIASAVHQFIKMVKGMVKTIVTAIVNFKNQVVNWFKNLPLIKGRHIPFISQREDFRTMLKNAPRKNCGIFEGVYDEQTDAISNLQYIAADQLDIQTKQVLGNEPIVVLE